MAYVETSNIKFVLTNYGKEEGLKRGLLNVMRYFTVSDNGVIYTMNVQPTNLLDVNGSHGTSTNVTVYNKNIIE
jgi:hypothetical protein